MRTNARHTRGDLKESRRDLIRRTANWAEPDTRYEVVDYVRHWCERTELPATRLVNWIGITRSKYYEWRRRYGEVNGHNAWIPRGSWLQDWEKQAIIDFAQAQRLDGYRRPTYMMIDANIVAVPT